MTVAAAINALMNMGVVSPLEAAIEKLKANGYVSQESAACR